jgi:hypothetical protein
MVAHDVLQVGSGLRPNSRGQGLASFKGCTMGVSRFSTHPLRERHPAGDEFLQVFEGELDITVLTPRIPRILRVRNFCALRLADETRVGPPGDRMRTIPDTGKAGRRLACGVEHHA